MPDALNPLSHPVCLLMPRRLTPRMAWHEHIPFGMLLVDLVRPAVLVELGTHYGDSYCAFCQAVRELGLPTRCYAVDTWQGDEQAGVYGPEVLADLRAHHDPLYGGFSRLVQSTFDEAAGSFPEGSIDLLHIDGFHTYEVVKHDFETWRPRLSARAVVLFHDINVREQGFGVWRLWEELKARYPHLEFAHGHGLGLVAVGPDVPPALRPLLDASPPEARRVRELFFELGHRLTLHARISQLETDLAHRTREVAEVRAVMDALQADREEMSGKLHGEIGYLRDMLRERTEEYYTLAAHAAWMNGHPVWRAYLGLRGRALPSGSRREAALRLARREVGRLAAEGPGAFGRRVWRRLRHGGLALDSVAGVLDRERQYQAWLAKHRPTAADLAGLRVASGRLPARPTISIVTPVYDVAEPWLREAIESVRDQAYEQWELCLVDDASTAAHVRPVLDEYAARDGRIRVEHLAENLGITGATNRGLALATGDFVGFLDHDDVLYPDALAEVALALGREPDLDVVYSDEDKVEPDGRRSEPFFKPDWSPDLLLGVNYTCHLSVYRRSLLERLGGLRPGFEGSQDHDLMLRVSEATARIGHVPKVLYGWRRVPASTAATVEAKPYAYQSGRSAVADALARRGREGTAELVGPGRYQVRYPLTGNPKVSIVIPMRDRAELTRQCVASIDGRSSYKNLELLVVDNGSVEPESRRFFEEIGLRHRVLPYDRPFNYSAINNFAAARATGDYLLFLNNDTEVDSADWIEAMLEHAQRPDVGAVGAKLLYPDRRIQHAGVFIMGTAQAFAGHAFKYLPEHTDVYFGLARVVRNVSAVTGACMMVRRQVFEQLGGFDERIRVAFNDVDLCLRLREAGYLLVYTPLATLIHHESATRKTLHPPDDDRRVRERWRAFTDRGDPYYNPHLSRTREDFALEI
jgi:GT2 family glycosyltransferase